MLLRLYRALIRSKLDYGCSVYGSAKPSYIKRLDTVHNQGLRLCLGAFRTSPVQSLYVEANEPPLGMRRTRLSLQYCVKLMSNEVNPAYSAVFQSDFVATYESFTDYTHIFTDGSKDGDKTAAAFICQSFEFSKRLPDKASIFTAELEAIVSALRYVKSTTKRKKFVIFGDSKSALQALLSKWDHPTVQSIMRFFSFLTYYT